jgi:spermidine/putrescine transport system substrate-binding protein
MQGFPCRQAASPRHHGYPAGAAQRQCRACYFSVPKGALQRAAADALIDFLLTPGNNRDEVLTHNYPLADKRVLDLLPTPMPADPIMFPAAELLQPLEFAAAAALTNPLRAETRARFRAA